MCMWLSDCVWSRNNKKETIARCKNVSKLLEFGWNSKNDEISMKRANDVKLIESDEGKLCEWVNDGRRAFIRLK